MAYENSGAKVTVFNFKETERENVWIRLTVRAKVINKDVFKRILGKIYLFWEKQKIL